MKLLKLEFSNFLSYRRRVVLELSDIHKACVVGPNGSGKSSVLDAITWALYGKSRCKSDDDLVNRIAGRKGKAARVQLTFELDNVIHRITRQKRVGKTGVLVFEVQKKDETWHTLVEGTLRETQAAIELVLRMNYSAFINASFFLQGKADEFTIKTPGKRKEILAELFDIKEWDRYKEIAIAERKQEVGRQLVVVSKLETREKELERECLIAADLPEAEKQLQAMSEQLELHKKLLEKARLHARSIEEQKELVERLSAALVVDGKSAVNLGRELEEAEKDGLLYRDILSSADQITNDYARWEQASDDVERYEDLAKKHHAIQLEKHKHALVIEGERVQLEQMIEQLDEQSVVFVQSKEKRSDLIVSKRTTEKVLRKWDEDLKQLAEKNKRLIAITAEVSKVKAEHNNLVETRLDLSARIAELSSHSGGSCPLCNQTLTDKQCSVLLAELQQEDRALEERSDLLALEIVRLDTQIEVTQTLLKQQSVIESRRVLEQQRVAGYEAGINELDKLIAAWEESPSSDVMSPADMQEVHKFNLENNAYAHPQRQALEVLVAQEDQLGYDESKHTAAALLLRDELSGAPEEHRALQSARTIIEPLNDKIANLKAQIEQKITLASELEQAIEQLALLHRTGLSVESAEREVQRFEGEQIKVHRRIAIVQQSLDRVKELEVQQEAQQQEKSEVAQRIRRLNMLEKTCGREGVQALLIENVLPEIEDDANEILERLTDGQMQVALETQRQHKTSDRVAETLDIHIADSEGVRPYENYSGGEQFRVNFAIRLALSRILARRSGAKLQTLVIDEGFGSQDPAGRQRLLEAIDIVSADFKLILIVSHIEEMRDAFETWISVEKDASGSAITVT